MNRQRGATKFETLLLMLIILLVIFLVIPIYNSVMDKSPVTHSTEKQPTDLHLWNPGIESNITEEKVFVLPSD